MKGSSLFHSRIRTLFYGLTRCQTIQSQKIPISGTKAANNMEKQFSSFRVCKLIEKRRYFLFTVVSSLSKILYVNLIKYKAHVYLLNQKNRRKFF